MNEFKQEKNKCSKDIFSSQQHSYIPMVFYKPRKKSITARNEAHFLCGKDKESFVKGYIILVVESERGLRQIVFPVKTLVEAYRDQVKAYVGAVLGIFGGTVKEYLYSTVEGELVYVE